jgi:hypothetical protein
MDAVILVAIAVFYSRLAKLPQQLSASAAGFRKRRPAEVG